MLQSVLRSDSGSQEQHGLQLSNPLANTLTAVKMLLSAGVQPSHIVVIGMPDFSASPLYSTQPAAVRWLIKEASHFYNFLLKSKIYWHAYGVHTYIDADFLSEMAADKKDFIPDAEEYTCVAYHDAPLCKINGKNFLFFNKKHPTQFAHQQFAKDLEKKVKQWMGPVLLNHS